MKFNPIAWCLIFAWPSAGSPTSTSSSCRTSGPPVLWKRIALAILSAPRIFLMLAHRPAGHFRCTKRRRTGSIVGTTPALHRHGQLFDAYQLEIRFALGNETDETADLRVNRFAEPAAAEDAIVPQAFRQQVLALVGRNAAAERLRRFGL